jgi:hypothetical protein
MRWVVCIGALLVLATAPVAKAQVTHPLNSIVSPPAGSATASDGPSDHTAFSQDNRDVRLLAFDSAADNLVAGDVNSHRDVFVLRKARGAGNTSGTLTIASVATNGEEANGDSADPSVDGTTGWAPRCVAFESTATNLARGDRTADLDVFVRDLRRHVTTLVSVGEKDAHDGSIDGRCRYVSFDARGRVFVRDLTARRTRTVAVGSRPDLQTDGRGVVYDRAGQVYYQALGPRGRRGPERLVSDNRLGQPGNGASGNGAVDDHGHFVAFESTATDLCTARCRFDHGQNYAPGRDPAKVPSGDANGAMSDIFRRRLAASPASPSAMTLITYDFTGAQADAPSFNPAISRAGHEVAFESAATNIGGLRTFTSGSDGFANVFTWYASGQRPFGFVSLQSLWSFPTPYGRPGFNGSTIHPSMSSRGNYLAFTSREFGYGGESNGGAIPDVFVRWVRASDEGLPTR